MAYVKTEHACVWLGTLAITAYHVQKPALVVTVKIIAPDQGIVLDMADATEQLERVFASLPGLELTVQPAMGAQQMMIVADMAGANV